MNTSLKSDSSLRRSKSMCSLDRAVVVCTVIKEPRSPSQSSDAGTECSEMRRPLASLEQKMQRLNDLFLTLLSSIKSEIQDLQHSIDKSGYMHDQPFTAINDKQTNAKSQTEAAFKHVDDNMRARSLLSALDVSRAGAPPPPALYRRAQTCLDWAFAHLHEPISQKILEAARGLRCTQDQQANEAGADHTSTLRQAVEELLDKELKHWRQKILDHLLVELQSEPEPEARLPGPAQPSTPEISVIDKLMQTAEITKQISEGDVDAAFTSALSASDLSLVTAACRAAAPGALAALRQPVLLALAQQLATDMVADTQLKCRYLEDALINLDGSNPATKEHLPMVLGEVRKHLVKFVLSYPNHVASRRITLIVMAADNLLKYYQ